jgi:hypothetical protein
MLDTSITAPDFSKAIAALQPEQDTSFMEAPGSDPRGERLSRVSRDLGRQVRSVELRVDRAGSAIAKLLIHSLEAQHEAKLAASYSQPAITDFVDALKAWDHSRSLVVAGHDKLFKIAGVLGTQIIAGGDIERPA